MTSMRPTPDAYIRTVALGVACLAGLGAIAAAKKSPPPPPEVVMPVVKDPMGFGWQHAATLYLESGGSTLSCIGATAG